MRKTLIISGWVLVLLMVVGIFGANVYAFVIGRESDVLMAWGSAAIGFIFGSFPTMVRDFLRSEEPASDAPTPIIDLTRLRGAPPEAK